MTDPSPVAPSRKLRIMLVAGEPSGDALGGRLMAALKLRTLGRVQFLGVGGERMAEQGLASHFPMSDLSVMGLVEVLPRIPRVLRRIGQLARFVLAEQPDAVVTIDAPGFNMRLARRLRGRGIPLIHYVAPTVWAWRPKRARKSARLLDHLLVLLPFEPPYFEHEGLATTFVGHPVIETQTNHMRAEHFRAQHGIDPATPLLAVLPGSRSGEVRRHLPVFGAAVALLHARFPDLRLVMPTVGPVAGEVREAAAHWAAPAIIVENEAMKLAAMAACNAALAASGTVALELAVAGVPSVIAYRLHPLTAALARRLVKVRYVNLVNILLNRPAVPELLQENCEPEKLAAAVERVMIDPNVREAQRSAAAEAVKMLGYGGEAPSLRAADAILRAIAVGPRRR